MATEDVDPDLDNVTREPNPQDLAAIKLQRAWRRCRRRRGTTLDTAARWEDAVVRAKIQTGRQAAHDGKNDPRSRWRRASALAGRLQDRKGLLMQRDHKNCVIHGHEPMDKQLETQHWLELIDGKHRYGANLKCYHRRWEVDDTTDNFFRWLDYGNGKELSLPECSREQLENERILYLSAEQRLNYLVKIDDEGKLRWARNNEFVDTSAGHWKDLGNGLGVVPTDGMEPATSTSHHRQHSFSGSSTASPTHYTDHIKTGSRISRMFKSRFTTAGLTDRLLRMTVRKNTWIYVSDIHFNIFIGIKDTGSFQHSSFLSGGLVSSAGLISVQDGIIHSLSPLSGHYRLDHMESVIDILLKQMMKHFKDFVEGLDEHGAYLGKLKISKAEGILWCLENYGKFKKAKNAWLQKQKNRVKRVVRKPRKRKDRDLAESTHEDSPNNGQEPDRQWREDILHGRRPPEWSARLREVADAVPPKLEGGKEKDSEVTRGPVVAAESTDSRERTLTRSSEEHHGGS